jgi:glycosyltransferase 2 family protein
MLLLLPPAVSNTALFGSLIAYRAVYYLLPLSVAILLLAVYKIRSRQVEN